MKYGKNMEGYLMHIQNIQNAYKILDGKPAKMEELLGTKQCVLHELVQFMLELCSSPSQSLPPFLGVQTESQTIYQCNHRSLHTPYLHPTLTKKL
jgi:hypothetical protein